MKLTRDEILALHGEELNRAVLEQLDLHISTNKYGAVKMFDGDGFAVYDAGTFAEDLNLVFKLEITLNLDQYRAYIRHLCSIVYDGKSDAPMGWMLAHANAEQRCKAYLMTVNEVE